MNTTVADTIWSQISLNTKMACGARSPMADGNKLTFSVGRGTKNYITVTLDPSDTYTVEHIRVGPKYSVKVIESVSDVYCDNLSEVVYRMVNK